MTFVNNSAYSVILPVLNWYGSGAVAVGSHSGGGQVSVLISASNFTGNYGVFSPGALVVATVSELTISDTVGANNVGGFALLFYCTTVYVTNCTFHENQGITGAGGTSALLPINPGGAVITAEEGTNMTVSGCRFHNNSALASGGGLFVSYYTNLVISDCSFDGNLAHTGYGGAVNLGQLTGLYISHTSFSNNVAGSAGGAVNIEGVVAFASISNSSFSNNSAGVLTGPDGWGTSIFAFTQDEYTTAFKLSRGGGALWMTKVTLISIQDSQFYGNTAAHSLGGAVRIRFSGAGLVRNCSFVGNSALSGEF